MARPQLSKADYERLAQFRHLLRRFLQFSAAAAQRAGLTPQQHQALLAIKGYPGRDRVTTGELAQRLGIRHNSSVGLIDRLCSKGLVQRSSGEHDRREVWIALTPVAEALLERLSATHREELKRIAGPLRRLLGSFEAPVPRRPRGRRAARS